MNNLNISIVDSQSIFAYGCKCILEKNSDIKVEIGDETLLNNLLEKQTDFPDILLVEGRILKAIAASLKDVIGISKNVIIHSDSENVELAIRAIGLGVNGFLLKTISQVDLIDVVRSVHSGQTYISPCFAPKVISSMSNPTKLHVNVNSLTAREEQILQELRSGKTNLEIARHLEISDKTVKHYMTNIFQKLHVKNRLEAALIANKFFG